MEELIPEKLEQFAYWINEREQVRKLKESGVEPPWSADRVFQTTYFTNVRREDDRVTRFVRSWLPNGDDPRIVVDTILARMINWPDTLKEIPFVTDNLQSYCAAVQTTIEYRERRGLKVWGGAYVITTHGIPMPKSLYLTQRVLPDAWGWFYGHPNGGAGSGVAPRLVNAYNAIKAVEGLGSFLSAQVVADLKNELANPLSMADDWWTFCAPGPGSMRGLRRIFPNLPKSLPQERFEYMLENKLRIALFDKTEVVPRICNQDLQNCLCEFDKYVRVKTGEGRSKRRYDGS